MLFNFYYSNNNLIEKKAQLEKEGYSLNILQDKGSFIPHQVLKAYKATSYGNFSWDYLKQVTDKFTKPLPYWLGLYGLDPLENNINLTKSITNNPTVPKGTLIPLPLYYSKGLSKYMLYSSINLFPFLNKELHFKDNIVCNHVDDTFSIATEAISVESVNITNNPEDYYVIVTSLFEDGYCDGALDGGWVYHTELNLMCLHFVKVKNDYLPVIYLKFIPEEETEDISQVKSFVPIRDEDGYVIDIELNQTPTVESFS